MLEVVARRTRLPGRGDAELPRSAGGLSGATVHQRRSGGGGQAQETIGFPGALDPEQAAALLEDWLGGWSEPSRRSTFAVAAPDARVEPGALSSGCRSISAASNSW